MVIGLQSTGEMALNDMLERRGAETAGLYSAMHEQITSFVMKYFPTLSLGVSELRRTHLVAHLFPPRLAG